MPDLLLKGLSVSLNRVVFRVEHDGIVHRVVLSKVILDELDAASHTTREEIAGAFARNGRMIMESTLCALKAGRRGDANFTLLLGSDDFADL